MAEEGRSAQEARSLSRSPFAPFLERQGCVVLDGGLATSLESLGEDLDDPLWSARVLLERPQRIVEACRSFLEAGADVVATASYQATFEGLARRGLTDGESEALLRRSVELALEARDEFWRENGGRGDRLRPLVAASVGPYGAFLADGSEYRGDYGLDEDALYRFHARRWRVLAGSSADLLACETIPSGVEAAALLRLLDESPGRWAWLSFTLRDPEHLSDGTALAPLLGRLAADRPDAFLRLAAVGVNCVSPGLAEGALSVLAAATDRPICLYPNSGEGWDAAGHRWTGDGEKWIERTPEWRRRGALVLGGCCRTSPRDIRRLRELLLGSL